MKSATEVIRDARTALWYSGVLVLTGNTPLTFPCNWDNERRPLSEKEAIVCADSYNALAAIHADPLAFAIKLVEENTTPEQAALFKLFWSGDSQDGE